MIRLAALAALLLTACSQANDRPVPVVGIPTWICIHDSPQARTCFTWNEVAQVIECRAGAGGMVRLVFWPQLGRPPEQYAFQERRYFAPDAFQAPPPGDDQLAFFRYGDELLLESFEPCVLEVFGGAP